MIRLKNKFSYFSLTIMILVYAFNIYFYVFETINIHFLELFILLGPIVIVMTISLLSSRVKLSKKVIKVVIIFTIVVFVLLEFWTFIWIMIKEGSSYEDNVHKYNHIINVAGNSSYIYQFPKKIDDEFITKYNPKFYYAPQFLQAPFKLELLLNNCTEGDMLKFVENKNIQNKFEIRNEENIEELFQEHNAFLLNICSIDDEEYINFFNNSKVYIIESKANESSNWNHGYGIYIIYNKNPKQILYLSQKW